MKNRNKELQKFFNNEDFSLRMTKILKGGKAWELFKGALTTIALDPRLKNCDINSIVKSAKDIAEIGLDINPLLGQAYIVSYKANAQAIIGYKGYITLADRYGKEIQAHAVFDCDNFKIDYSYFGGKVKFTPQYHKRPADDIESSLKGVLVMIRDKESGNVRNDFVPINKLLKIAGQSKSKNAPFSPYKEWGEEMYLAKGIKYILSRIPMNEFISRAIQIDNVVDTDLVINDKEEKPFEIENKNELVNDILGAPLEVLDNSEDNGIIEVEEGEENGLF